LPFSGAEVTHVRIVTKIAAPAALVLLFGLATPTAAQGRLGAGVSWLDEAGTGTGMTFDYAHPIVPFTTGTLSAVGDLGFNWFDGTTVSSYLGGVRYQLSFGRVAPFGQFLLGAEHCCGATDFAIQPGFGVDITITPLVGFRGQVDFRNVALEGGDLNGQRYTFGISLAIPTRR
jgi:hypothetical protein